MSKVTFESHSSEEVERDDKGNIVKSTHNYEEKFTKHETEPDYIKLYADMWCTFKGIPAKWKTLFLVLALRMSYASMPGDNSEKKIREGYGGQIVYTFGKLGDEICEACGWKQKQSLYDGLRALCKYNVIKQVERGIYQINPEFVGKGGWNYDKKTEQGGIKNLRVTFNFADKSNDTNITWNDDDDD